MENEYESNLDENNVVPEKSNLKRNLTFIGVAILSIATITQIYNRNEFEQLSAAADALCLKVDDPKIWTSRNERIKLEKEVDSAIATLYSLAEDAGIDIETLIADSDNNVDAITLVKQTLGYDTTTCENIDNVENNPNEESQTSEQSNSETNNGDSDNDNASEDTVNNDEPVSNDNDASTSNGNSNDSSNTDSNSNGDSSSNGNGDGDGDGTTGGGSNGNKTEEPPTNEPNPPSDNNNNETPPPTGETPPEEIVEVIPEITNLEASQTTINKEVELSWTGDEEIVSYDIWKDGFLYASNIPATDSNPDLDGIQVAFTIPDAEYGLHQYNVIGNYVTTSGESKHVQASISYENYIVPEYSNMSATSVSQTDTQEKVMFQWEINEPSAVVVDETSVILTIDKGTVNEQIVNVTPNFNGVYEYKGNLSYGEHTWEVSANIYNEDTNEDIGIINSGEQLYFNYLLPEITSVTAVETTDNSGLDGTNANIEISYTSDSHEQTWNEFVVVDNNTQIEYGIPTTNTKDTMMVALPYGVSDYSVRGYYTTTNNEIKYVDSESITIDVLPIPQTENFTFTESDLQETTSDVMIAFDFGNENVVAENIDIFVDGSSTPITLSNDIDNHYETTLDNITYGTHTIDLVVTPESVSGTTEIVGTINFSFEFTTETTVTVTSVSAIQNTGDITSTISWEVLDIGKQIQSFNIYIDDMVTPIANVSKDTYTYTTEKLSVGTHIIKVEAVYADGVSSAATSLGIVEVPLEIATLEVGQIDETASTADVIAQWNVNNPMEYTIESMDLVVKDSTNTEVYTNSFTVGDPEFTPDENGVYTAVTTDLNQGYYIIDVTVNYQDYTNTPMQDVEEVPYEVTGKPFFNGAPTATQVDGTNNILIDVNVADLEPYSQIFDSAVVHVSNDSAMNNAQDVIVPAENIDFINQTITVDLTEAMCSDTIEFNSGTIYYTVELFYSNGNNSVTTAISNLDMVNIYGIETISVEQDAANSIDAIDVSWTDDNNVGVLGYNVYINGELNNASLLPPTATTYKATGDFIVGETIVSVEAVYENFDITKSTTIDFMNVVHLNQENFLTDFKTDSSASQIYYILDEDIDVTGENLPTITLYGVLDGNGHSITGDGITTMEDQLIYALRGTVKNLTINETQTTTTYQIVGPFKTYDYATVDNVTINYPDNGITTTSTGIAYIGGNASSTNDDDYINYTNNTINGKVIATGTIIGIQVGDYCNVSNNSINVDLITKSNSIRGIDAGSYSNITNNVINGDMYATDNPSMNSVIYCIYDVGNNASITNNIFNGNIESNKTAYGIYVTSTSTNMTNNVINANILGYTTSYGYYNADADNYYNTSLDTVTNTGTAPIGLTPSQMSGNEQFWVDTLGFDPTIWNFDQGSNCYMPYLKSEETPTLVPIYGLLPNAENIEVTTYPDNHDVTVTWENNGEINSTGIEIYIDDVLVSSLPKDTTTATITDVDLGTHELYIKTKNEFGGSVNSYEVTFEMYPAFEDITTTLNPDNTATITWSMSQYGSDVTGFNIYQNTETTPLNATPLTPDTFTYTTGVLNSGTHYFTIEALYDGGSVKLKDDGDITIVPTVYLNQENFITEFKSDSSGSPKNYVLEEDIYLTGVDFTPISYLYGTFDGNGYSITGDEITTQNDMLVNNLYGTFKNVTINEVATTTSAPIMGPVKGNDNSVIDNVTINYPEDGITSTSASISYALNAGYDSNTDHSTVKNCTINGKITTSGQLNAVYAGDYATVDSNTINAEMNTTNTYVRGIYVDTYAIVTNNIINGNLSATENVSNSYAYGISGSSNSTVSNNIINANINSNYISYGINNGSGTVTNNIINSDIYGVTTSYGIYGSDTNNYINSELDALTNSGTAPILIPPNEIATITFWTDTILFDPLVWNTSQVTNGYMPYLNSEVTPTLIPIHAMLPSVENIVVNIPDNSHNPEISWENNGIIEPTGIEVYIDNELETALLPGATSCILSNISLGYHELYIKTINATGSVNSETIYFEMIPEIGVVTSTLNADNSMTVTWDMANYGSEVSEYNIYLDNETTPLNTTPLPLGTTTYTTEPLSYGTHTLTVEAVYNGNIGKSSVKEQSNSQVIIETVYLNQENFITDFKSDTSSNPKNYVLEEDINLTGLNNTSITLYGTLDGNGHSITGDEITTTTDILIGSLHGTIQNVTINEVATSTTAQITGPAKMMSNSTMNNVTINYPEEGIVTSSSNGASGIYADYNADSVMVSNNTLNGSISTSNNYSAFGIYISNGDIYNNNINLNITSSSGGAYGIYTGNGDVNITNNIINGSIDGGIKAVGISAPNNGVHSYNVINSNLSSDQSIMSIEGYGTNINNYVNSSLPDMTYTGTAPIEVTPEEMATVTFWTDTVMLDPVVWNTSQVTNGYMPYLNSEEVPTLIPIVGLGTGSFVEDAAITEDNSAITNTTSETPIEDNTTEEIIVDNSISDEELNVFIDEFTEFYTSLNKDEQTIFKELINKTIDILEQNEFDGSHIDIIKEIIQPFIDEYNEDPQLFLNKYWDLFMNHINNK